MKRFLLAITLLLGIGLGYAQQGIRNDSWHLIWHDEFDASIDWTVWQSEHGFVRNADYAPDGTQHGIHDEIL